MTILFFTTALEHTTFQKTAKMLQKEGVQVKMLGFNRNNSPALEKNELNVESFGSITHGNYFSRALRLIKVIPSLIRNSKNADVIYNFTLDTLIISRLFLPFKRKKWVYHIQDIRSIYFGDSIKNIFFRFLEKYYINRVDVVVVSSFDYYSGFFKKRYNLLEDKVHIIENKLTPSIFANKTKFKLVKNKITIGYFGVLRCKRSWSVLIKLANEFKNEYDIYLRGKSIVINNIENEIIDMKNIIYDGMYRSPEDLNEIYSKVNIVWAAYPYSAKSDGNWKYARTIRFYEACAFGKPVIVQKGTPQAKEVEKYKIGIVIDMKYIQDTVNVLSVITFEQISEWSANIKKLPYSYYIHKNEYSELLRKIKQHNE